MSAKAADGFARVYRCYHCADPAGIASGFEFTAASHDTNPACPSCGTAIDSPLGGAIATVLLIHYEPPAQVKEGTIRAQAGNTKGAGVFLGFGSGHIACDPSKPTSSGRLASASPEAVTCPACWQTEAMKAVTVGQINPRFDMPASFQDGGIRLLGAPGDAEPDLEAARATSAALRRQKRPE